MIFDYDFLSDCPSFKHGIAIRYVQHCKSLLEHGVCVFYSLLLGLNTAHTVQSSTQSIITLVETQ